MTGAEADRLRYTPGLHNLALLELFGFVTLDHSSSKPGQLWPVERVQRTSLGEAMLAVCAKWFADFDNVLNFDELESMEPGQFQPFFRSYFPEWRNNLILPQQPFREGVFVFKVMLDKNCWRRIAIPADATLEDLSDAILVAYQFDYDHLYRFVYASRSGLQQEAFHPEMDDGPWASEVLIGDLPLRLGMSILYNYDFGDNWYFDVMLERIDPPNDTLEQATILEEAGEAPAQYGWDEDDEDDEDEDDEDEDEYPDSYLDVDDEV